MAVKEQLRTADFAVYNGDCIEVMSKLPDQKVHLSIYSPPFGGLYHYSSSAEDLSNSKDYGEFFEHYAFVVKQLHRLTVPGRITSVHCMDVPSGNSGVDHMIDFGGDVIRLHEQNGWKFIARYCVWKEPLEVRNRTMSKKLAHRAVVEDSSRCSCAAADYLLVFRRSGTNPVPIAKPVGFTNYAGSRQMPSDILHLRGYEGNQIQNR
jgi:hypothetical protein